MYHLKISSKKTISANENIEISSKIVNAYNEETKYINSIIDKNSYNTKVMMANTLKSAIIYDSTNRFEKEEFVNDENYMSCYMIMYIHQHSSILEFKASTELLLVNQDQLDNLVDAINNKCEKENLDVEDFVVIEINNINVYKAAKYLEKNNLSFYTISDMDIKILDTILDEDTDISTDNFNVYMSTVTRSGKSVRDYFGDDNKDEDKEQ